MSSDLELELHVDDELVASVSGPRAQTLTEMRRYWAQYGGDGECTVYEVKRTKINIEDVLGIAEQFGLPANARVIATCDLSTTAQETPPESCKECGYLIRDHVPPNRCPNPNRESAP